MKNILILSVIVLVVIMGIFVFYQQAPVGSVNRANEYHAATTTSADAGSFKVVKSSSAILGSLVVASSSPAAVVKIMNATSSSDTASTTFTTLRGAISQGTYTFDAILTRGLVFEFPVGFNGDWVITYR